MSAITSIWEKYEVREQKSIMAVDNAPLMLGQLKSIITAGGYSFTSTRSGKDVLELVEMNKPDLLILRKDMPGMDGYEIAEKLNEHGYSVPMIFISSEATKESVVKAHRAGVKDYLVQPIDKETTLRKIEKQLV